MDILQPDADLLALCVSLKEMEAEWWCLYEAALSDELHTVADQAWRDYSNRIWPGIRLAAWNDQALHPDDLPGRLRLFHAMSAEGEAAKATAILAMEKVAPYCGYRDDACLLAFTLLRDVAGIEAHKLGADAAGRDVPP